MSNLPVPAPSPKEGYRTESLLTNIVKKKGAEAIKKNATTFASSKLNQLEAQAEAKLGNKLAKAGLGGSAFNSAVAGARSASDKINAGLGGKLSSTLGKGISGLASNAAAGATSTLKNLATGAVSNISSQVKNKLGGALSGALGSSLGGVLGGKLSTLTDNAAKALSGAQIAQGFLSTGPKDELLTIDVYGVSDNSIVNGTEDKDSGFFGGVFDDIRKAGGGMLSDLNAMVRSGDVWALDKNSLKDRVLGSLGGKMGALNALSGIVQNNLNNATGLPDNIFGLGEVKLGDVAIELKNIRASDCRGVFNLMNQITRNSDVAQFFDVGSEASLMSGVFREAIALGVPGAIDTLVENANSDQAAYYALHANLRVALEYADIDTLNLMLTKMGANAILAQEPSAVQLLLSSYTLPAGKTSENYQLEREGLLAFVESLDPNWNRSERDGVWTSDLTAYSGISPDLRTLFQQDETLLIPTLIGAELSSEDLLDGLRKRYPLVPLL